MSEVVWLVQTILEACEADLQSCVDRDPACEKFSQCMLYFKGFQAIQCHRLNHWLWRNNRRVSPVPCIGCALRQPTYLIMLCCSSCSSLISNFVCTASLSGLGDSRECLFPGAYMNTLRAASF